MEFPSIQKAEASYYICMVISAVLYGVYFGVYCLSILAILHNPNIIRSRRILYTSFSSLLLLLNSLPFFSALVFGIMVWVIDRKKFLNNPGGYLLECGGSVYLAIGSTSQNIAIFLSQALLIYRCYIVFGSRLRIILLPALLSIAAFVMLTISMGLDSDLFFGPRGHMHEVAAAIGIALAAIVDMMITAMVSTKILVAYHNVRKFVSHEATKTYMNIVAIFVESAAPCALLGIICSVSILNFRKSIWWGVITFLIWSVSMMFFPQLIILRIVNGVAWTSTTSKDLSISSRTRPPVLHEIQSSLTRNNCDDSNS